MNGPLVYQLFRQEHRWVAMSGFQGKVHFAQAKSSGLVGISAESI